MSNLTKEKIVLAQWLLNPDRPLTEINNWPELERRLKTDKLEKVFYEIELPLLPVLRAMEERGIGVERKKIGARLTKTNRELAALQGKIHRLAGQKFNLNSSKQLAKIIFGREQSTSADKLEAIQEQSPLAALVLRYRELYKLKSTYLEPFLELSVADGRLHSQFLQTGTATGRLSSRRPNLQNLPETIRAFFLASAGHQLASFDYSQIELRVLSAVAGAEKMIKAFGQGLDIHQLTASQVFNVSLDRVTTAMRRLAKSLNFGVVYGMGAASFAQAAKISQEAASQFIEEFFNNFPEIKIWQAKTIAQARKQGFVENLNGRKRWLGPDVYRGVIINMPIQSLAADIIKLAMIGVQKKLRPRLLLSVHDELLFEIENDKVKEVSAAIKEIMESVYPLVIPLKVNVKLSNPL